LTRLTSTSAPRRSAPAVRADQVRDQQHADHQDHEGQASADGDVDERCAAPAGRSTRPHASSTSRRAGATAARSQLLVLERRTGTASAGGPGAPAAAGAPDPAAAVEDAQGAEPLEGAVGGDEALEGRLSSSVSGTNDASATAAAMARASLDSESRRTSRVWRVDMYADKPPIVTTTKQDREDLARERDPFDDVGPAQVVAQQRGDPGVEERRPPGEGPAP